MEGVVIFSACFYTPSSLTIKIFPTQEAILKSFDLKLKTRFYKKMARLFSSKIDCEPIDKYLERSEIREIRAFRVHYEPKQEFKKMIIDEVILPASKLTLEGHLLPEIIESLAKDFVEKAILIIKD